MQLFSGGGRGTHFNSLLGLIIVDAYACMFFNIYKVNYLINVVEYHKYVAKVQRSGMEGVALLHCDVEIYIQYVMPVLQYNSSWPLTGQLQRFKR